MDWRTLQNVLNLRHSALNIEFKSARTFYLIIKHYRPTRRPEGRRRSFYESCLDSRTDEVYPPVLSDDLNIPPSTLPPTDPNARDVGDMVSVATPGKTRQ